MNEPIKVSVFTKRQGVDVTYELPFKVNDVVLVVEYVQAPFSNYIKGNYQIDVLRIKRIVIREESVKFCFNDSAQGYFTLEDYNNNQIHVFKTPEEASKYIESGLTPLLTFLNNMYVNVNK